MTGERLYARSCSAFSASQNRARYADRSNMPVTPVAWSHLPFSERRIWNALGHRLNAKAARR